MSDSKRLGHRGQFVKGDPRINAGGRPAIAKAWAAATAGKTMAEVTAEALRLVYDRACEGPSETAKSNDPDWRFAMQKVLEYSAGKPKETVEVVGGQPERRAVDWHTVPIERRRSLLASIAELRALSAPLPEPDPEDPDDGVGPTEH